MIVSPFDSGSFFMSHLRSKTICSRKETAFKSGVIYKPFADKKKFFKKSMLLRSSLF